MRSISAGLREIFARAVIFSLAMAVFLPINAFADEIMELKNALEEQKKIIEILERRLKALEEKKADEGIEELKKKVESIEMREEAEHEAVSVMEALLPQFGKNMSAFGDVNFTTDSRERKNRSFHIGSVSLYTTATDGDRLNFLFEMAVIQHNDRSAVNLERLWLGYTFNDLLIARAGRFHTALGYWNQAYHHGKHLFVTTDRPFFLKFEDIRGVIPVHIIGLELAGGKEIGLGRFKYLLEFGNGPSLKIDRHMPSENKLVANNISDNNDSKQVILRATLEPSSIPGMAVGVSGTHFKAANIAKTVEVDENIFGFDLYYKRDRLEFIGEYFRLKNGTASANAYYLQASYAFDRFTPYLRHERLDSQSDDPYLGSLSGGNDRFQNIAGVRYDIDYFRSSIKAQYRHDDKKHYNTKDVFEFQWTFHF